ncbi:Hint domain-containing protein [Yoonia sp.]|uniref:Hint domain-containing protein n=1 Tax=Yoonia sp. TaxID=2212373 RepID=UPI003F6A5908
MDITRVAPAIPVFEDAFAALGHGAVLQTRNGPVAVEDLVPGDSIRLADGRYDTLLWRGTMLLRPDDPTTRSETGTLIRIMADTLGLGRPSPDLVLGPTARLFHRASGVRALTGSDAAFIPARDFVDGAQIISLRPAGPVNVYQLGFARHQNISVNGIEIESLHPGTAFSHGLRGDTLTQYLSLFPHKTSLDDFGTMRHPRLRLRDLELLEDR